MNDEFLHALRRDPPPKFTRELQRRLQRLPARRSAWSSHVRTMLAMTLLGGVAMAAALLLRDREEPLRVETPIAQPAAPSAPVHPTQPTTPARPDRQLPSVPSSPSPTQAEDEDTFVGLFTSSLARPLAEALAEQMAKYPGGARVRLMTLDDDQSLRALCAGANFVVASRRISDAERAVCQQWGSDVVEWKLGYQAVALAAAPTTELPALAPREVRHFMLQVNRQ